MSARGPGGRRHPRRQEPASGAAEAVTPPGDARPPRWGPTSSAAACLGVSGYLVGLALPQWAAFDVPLTFLVLLAIVATILGLGPPTRAVSLSWLPVSAFALARVASTLAAPDPPARLGLLAPLLPGLLLFLLLTEWITAPRHVGAVYVSLTLAGLVLAGTSLGAWWQSPAQDPRAWARAVPSPILVVRNDLTVVAVLAPVAMASAALHRARPVRLLVIAFLASLIVTIALLESRTTLVTTIVAIVSFAMLAWPRTSRPRIGRSVLLAAGVVALVLLVDALAGFGLVRKSLHDWQGNGRLALWAAAVAMFRDAPLLGHGPGGYALHYRAYLDTLQLPGWMTIDLRFTPWPHNLYVELLAEQGALGLASFLALAGLGLRHVHALRRSLDPEIRLLGAGAGAAFVAFLSAACLELTFLRPWVTILGLTLLGALSTLARAGPAAGPPGSRDPGA